MSQLRELTQCAAGEDGSRTADENEWCIAAPRLLRPIDLDGDVRNTFIMPHRTWTQTMELMHIYRQRRVTLILSGQTGPTARDLISGDGSHAAPLVSADDIRLRAYLKWESAGRPPGDGVPFWLAAERELVDEQHSGPVTDTPSEVLTTERSHV